MGCDFQISGSQPNPVERRKCLEFLAVLSAISPAVYPITYKNLSKAAGKPIIAQEEQQFITAFADPVYYSAPMVRMDKYPVFKKPDKDSAAYASCSKQAQWSPECFEGVICNGLPVIFDITAGGVLCSLHREPARKADGKQVVDWNWPQWLSEAEERGPCDRIKIFPGCHCRFSTGDPFYYVMAEILRQRFIPDLEIHADYDVEYYRTIFKELRYLQFFCIAPWNNYRNWRLRPRWKVAWCITGTARRNCGFPNAMR